MTSTTLHRWPAAALATLAAAVGLTACAQPAGSGAPAEPSSNTPSSASASGGLTAGTTLRLGDVTALTGYVAAYNEPLRNGIQLAVDDINAAGGVAGKVTLEISESDTKSEPAQAGSAAQDLLSQGAQVLLSVCDTDSQVAIAAVAQTANVLYLSPCNADPTIPQKFSTYWPVGMGANTQTAQIAQVASDQGAKTAYILNDPGILYITQITKYFTAAAQERGISVIGTDTFSTSSTDFSAQINKIRALPEKPDVIVTAMLTPDVATFIRQLRAAGLDTPVIGSDGGDSALTLEVGGDDIDGSIWTTFGYPSEGSATAAFYQEYEEQYGSKPDGSFAALGYATIQVLAAAIERADSTDGTAIADVLSQGITVSTALGEITYPGNGERLPVTTVAAIEARGGAFHLVVNDTPDQIPAP
jgi:branched-chain amino acid transport system substrate-binding protein